MKDQVTCRRNSQTMETPDKKLTRDEVKCPVCWSILMQPVTLPCTHSMCLECFQSTVREICFNCPCCRMRISNWSRKAEKQGGLVNQDLWEKIQSQFPKYVEARLLGEDSQHVREEDLELPALESDDVTIDTDIARVPNTNRKVNGAQRCELSNKSSNDETPGVEIASEALIRKLKADDGFGTQQVVLDNDVSELTIDSEPCSLEINDSLNTSPKKNNHQQCNPCRNLFSEWETDPAQNAKSSPKTKSSKGRRNSWHVDSVSTRKMSGKDRKRASKEKSTNTDKKSACDSSSSIASTSKRKTVFDEKGVSSSFVPVYSPRAAETAQVANAVAGTSMRLSLDSRTAELKNKNFDHIKRSQVQTSDTPDSINFEVNSYFRPIRSAPKTPPKQLPDGSYLPEPRLVKSTPIRLGSAPPMLTMSSLNPLQPTNNHITFDNKKSDFNEDVSNDKNGVPPSGRIFSPPPPILVHYALQGISPRRFMCSPEELSDGRTTKSPPQLDVYDSTINEDAATKRQISDLMYRKVQAFQLEQFRKRKMQEDKDRAYAEKLQRQLNRGHDFSRTRECSDMYAIRNWVKSPATSLDSRPASKEQPKPSKNVPGKRVTRTRNKKVAKRQKKVAAAPKVVANKRASTKRQYTKKSRVEEKSDTQSQSTRITRSQSKRVRKA